MTMTFSLPPLNSTDNSNAAVTTSNGHSHYRESLRANAAQTKDQLIKTLQQEIIELSKAMEDQRRIWQSRESTHEALVNKLAEERASCHQTELEFEELLSELKRRVDSHNAQDQASAATNETIAELTLKLSKAEKKIIELSTNNSELHKQNARNEKELSAVKKKYEIAKEKLRDLAGSIDTAIKHDAVIHESTKLIEECKKLNVKHIISGAHDSDIQVSSTQAKQNLNTVSSKSHQPPRFTLSSDELHDKYVKAKKEFLKTALLYMESKKLI